MVVVVGLGRLSLLEGCLLYGRSIASWMDSVWVGYKAGYEDTEYEE